MTSVTPMPRPLEKQKAAPFGTAFQFRFGFRLLENHSLTKSFLTST